MANEDDEFGFKSLAEAFKPEVVKQETAKAAKVAPPVVSQPVPTRPVAPKAAMPSLPEVKPEEVAASVPQMQVPELPPIQNPVFNPEFQKAAGVAALPVALGGAAVGAGAAYGLYKARKSIQDRSIGKPMTAPPEFGGNLGKQLQGMDMSKVSPSDLKLLQEYEAKRVARQTAAQPEINKQMGFPEPATPAPVATNPVPAQTPPTIQAEVQTPKVTLTAVNPQERMAGLMAGQEMANPLGGQASAYTEPLKAVEPPVEKNKGGRPKGAKTATAEERLAKKGGLPGMTKEEAGMRGHLLGMYGGKESPYAQQAYEQVKEILGYTPAYPADGKGGSLTQEEKGKILDWRKENIEGPKANLTHEMKKTLKGGSAAAIAALALTPAFVNASESQKRQMIGEALLPMSLTPSELESGTLTEKQLRAYQEAQKLGSPYRSVPPR